MGAEHRGNEPEVPLDPNAHPDGAMSNQNGEVHRKTLGSLAPVASTSVLPPSPAARDRSLLPWAMTVAVTIVAASGIMVFAVRKPPISQQPGSQPNPAGIYESALQDELKRLHAFEVQKPGISQPKVLDMPETAIAGDSLPQPPSFDLIPASAALESIEPEVARCFPKQPRPLSVHVSVTFLSIGQVQEVQLEEPDWAVPATHDCVERAYSSLRIASFSHPPSVTIHRVFSLP